MKKYLIGFVLGFGVHLLMGAVQEIDNSRELSRIESELSKSNDYLRSISRSLDRLDDPVSGSEYRVKVNK